MKPKLDGQRRWFGWLCLFACLGSAVAAHAEDRTRIAAQRWLLVPVVVAPLPTGVRASELAAPFEAELRASGASVIANADAAGLFEARHSSEPVRLDSDEMTRLLRSVSQAARHLALGDLPQAQQVMEGVYALSGPARDFLNREAVRARKIFDTCLMTAYLWERDHKRAQALHQMLECSRSFPGFRPEGRAYPPALREVFEQAKQQLNQAPATSLLVSSKERSGCGVRLNGIELGKSPISISDVRAGATRVQLECEPGIAGRIHGVELHPGENQLTIDPAFDDAVHTRSALTLGYADAEQRERRASSDARTIQQVLEASHVALLLVDGTHYPRVHVVPLSGTAGEVASLSYSAGEGYDHEAVVSAVKALLGMRRSAGRISAAKAPAPEVAQDEDSPVRLGDPQPIAAVRATPAPVVPVVPIQPAKPRVRATEQRLAAGLLLAVLGLGGMGSAWVIYAERQDLRTRPLTDDAALDVGTLETFYLQGSLIYALGGAGALILTLSDYFWLPDDAGVPAWAWVIGGLGLAAGFVGLGFAVTGPHCRPEYELDTDCFRTTADETFGPLLAMHGLPLLGIPMSYALRALVRPDNVQVGFNLHLLPNKGALLSMRGVF